MGFEAIDEPLANCGENVLDLVDEQHHAGDIVFRTAIRGGLNDRFRRLLGICSVGQNLRNGGIIGAAGNTVRADQKSISGLGTNLFGAGPRSPFFTAEIPVKNVFVAVVKCFFGRQRSGFDQGLRQ